ncbi:MAG: aminotransferase class V-fold PLP-dependent enzyme [Gemmatimonas sp.]|jgi:isopenicillin-N epimerase|uniref:aminotransferase class V-fold PLP-dependent enzyme n=1 Tax=Gemmatimonas sp. TaxID=1962908 RepID=UPI0022C051F7|nr:aminotransferase class V-fold PLP-dependent enzyme [Gemmatimonas sp.]MCE2955014.1 aminotransferase class V-fold PLP-dependent enzyme [Gemmatimonas sp.]MCZ8011015.1 aminotransferase class V-fold PLP-dependent enzyme [Gemmatimonas sp.]MCZ8266164.1 aminotransferase class V-fold PLP-dependent enzyme [Gemmatimonas sp.]
MTQPRRDFVKQAAAVGAASLAFHAPVSAAGAASVSGNEASDPPPLAPLPGPLQAVVQDEAYWSKVATQYPVTDAVINLEAGYFGIMAAPVLAAHHRHVDRVNRESSYFARRAYPPILMQARDAVAQFVGAKPTEIVLSRGATEALQALITQYRGVKAGDTVLYADLDYNAMQWAMNALAAARGATVARLAIPEPATRENVLAAYAQALDAHPRTKLVLLTHCNNKTGLIIPVQEIAALAKARGADVVVDAAHSFGQVPLTVRDLGADFVGLNLHKWIGAPVGAGAMFIREGRFDAIDRMHADEAFPLTRIESRLHTGTTSFATVMTIPDAIAFQQSIGVPQKAARLRFLRDRWVHAVRDVPGVNILTPDAPALVGAITGFRLHGRGTKAANEAVAKTLLDEFGIFTFPRTGIAGGDCVRVTPTLFNTPAQLDTLAAALQVMAARG